MPQLRTHLAHQALLTFHLKLQFAFIEENQRLSFFDCVADVGENFRDSCLYLRAKRAFFKRIEGSHRLHAAARRLFGNRVDVRGHGPGNGRGRAIRSGVGAAAKHEQGEAGECGNCLTEPRVWCSDHPLGSSLPQRPIRG